jgi:hypothetical protein
VFTRGWDVQAQGGDKFVRGGSSGAVGQSSTGASSNAGRLGAGADADALTEGEQRKVGDGVLFALARRSWLRIPAVQLQTFLDSTCSQLTYHNLCTLASLNMPLPPPSASTEKPQLFALFHNAHLNVLYKHPAGVLRTLATDEMFLREPSAVRERPEDVDQVGVMFLDTRFERSMAVGVTRLAGCLKRTCQASVTRASAYAFVCFPFYIRLVVLQSCAGTQAAGGGGC